MKVILEGPDGAGKTTLAEYFQKRGYGYEHHGLYDDSPAELLDRYTRSVLRADSDVVIDRCYLSEYVYGTVMRQHDRLGAIGYTVMRRLCRARGVAELICLPRWETVLGNWLEKRKDKFDPVNRKGDYVDAVSRLVKVYDLYAQALNTEGSGFRKFDYQQWELPKWLTIPRPLPRMMTGSASARYLIVGEQINTKCTDEQWSWDLPFHSLTGSSLYLTQALHTAGYDERDLAFVNAYRSNGEENRLADAAAALPQLEKIVALGGRAADVCQKQSMEFISLPHPAYWKRFKSSSFHEYVNKLREVRYENRIPNFLRCVVEPAVGGGGVR